MRLPRAAALLFPLVLATAIAQDATFEASIDKNPVGVGDQLTLTLSLNNAGMGGGSNLRLPSLDKFQIMSGPIQSSNVQIVNGSVSSSVTYAYVLQPKEMGKFTIGPCSIDAGGKTYRTSPIEVEVVKGSPRPKQQAAANAGAGEIGDNLFLRATVDRLHVIQGEQINLTFKVYTRVNVDQYGIQKSPTMAGFWSEDIDIPKTGIPLSAETVNGKQYKVGVIKKMALFPTQSGTLEIGPMDVQTSVRLQSRSTDPFDAFFRDPFGRNVNYTITSEPLKIKVDPLPPGAPADFKGAVGQFAMSTSVDKKTTRTNEPVDFKITLSGTGNIKLLESPGVELPPDFEQYTPKVSDNINRQGERISGSKTFDYVLIPRYPGLKIIKPVTFSYYDLGRREYVKLRSPQIELNVEQGAAAAGPYIAGANREDVRLLNQDIRFIKVGSPAFMRQGAYLYRSGLFLALVLIPVVGFVGAFVYARQRESILGNQVVYRNRQAIKIARKGLKQAEFMLKQRSGSKGTPSSLQRLRFYAEVSRALWKYLGDKLNIPQSAFSVERAIAELNQQSVPPEILSALKSLLEGCDMARFAPTSMELSAMQRTYDEASRIIVELERTLKSA